MDGGWPLRPASNQVIAPKRSSASRVVTGYERGQCLQAVHNMIEWPVSRREHLPGPPGRVDPDALAQHLAIALASEGKWAIKGRREETTLSKGD
jgi:hypothetical protein